MKRDPEITGSGSYLPDTVLENKELGKRLDRSAEWIRSRTGIKQRHVAEDDTTGSMAVAAGRQAIEDAGIRPGQVELTLLATSTPDQPLPPTAPKVQAELGVPGGGFDIAGSCVGFLDALSAASQYIRNDTHQTVLVIGSNHLTYRLDWSDPATAPLFADGAGAILLHDPEGTSSAGATNELIVQVEGVRINSDGTAGPSVEVPAGGSREPFTPEAWEKNRHVMRMRNGQGVFKEAVQRQVRMGKQVVEEQDQTLDDIDWLLPHQANKKIMTSVCQGIGLEEDRLLSNIEYRGNTSAASIPILLDEKWREGILEDGDRILTTAFGSGIRIGAAMFVCEGRRS